MSTMPRTTASVPLSTKNDAMPTAMYTTANTASLVGDDGLLPTCPSGRLGSGRSNGPTRFGRTGPRFARAGGNADFLGVTRPGLRLSLATDDTVLLAT